MNILISGGAGYIGSQISHDLIDKGYSLMPYGWNNFIYSDNEMTNNIISSLMNSNDVSLKNERKIIQRIVSMLLIQKQIL